MSWCLGCFGWCWVVGAKHWQGRTGTGEGQEEISCYYSSYYGKGGKENEAQHNEARMHGVLKVKRGFRCKFLKVSWLAASFVLLSVQRTPKSRYLHLIMDTYVVDHDDSIGSSTRPCRSCSCCFLTAWHASNNLGNVSCAGPRTLVTFNRVEASSASLVLKLYTSTGLGEFRACSSAT